MQESRSPNELLLVRRGLDRAAHLRTDEAWLIERVSDARSRAMWISRGAVAVDENHELVTTALTSIADIAPEALTFLGVDEHDHAYFVIHLPEPSHPALEEGLAWKSLREVGHRLPDREGSMAVTAVALDNWRGRTRACPGCGGELAAASAGWSMRCSHESTDHFPRTDPAVIVLVRDEDDRALLGRHVNWEPGWVSTIAGFVEAGESAEAAVRREVLEETGVRVGDRPDHVAYLGSQPWPFPASLMLGYHAWVGTRDESASRITVDQTEIAEAHWFSRADLLAACEAATIRLPPRLSISRFLIEQWYGEDLPGDWLRG